jgi:hypothetical protein
MAAVLCTCILIGIGIGICSGQIFTPPPPGEKPVISNGIVYNLRHTDLILLITSSATILVKALIFMISVDESHKNFTNM